MKNLILLFSALSFVSLFAQPSFAKHPKSGLIIKGYWMYEKSNRRVEGRLSDLSMHKDGPRGVDENSCYVGSISKVCDILKTAAKEANDKSGKEIYLDSCKHKDGPSRSDRIKATFRIEGDSYTTKLIPVCDGFGVTDDPWDVGI